MFHNVDIVGMSLVKVKRIFRCPSVVFTVHTNLFSIWQEKKTSSLMSVCADVVAVLLLHSFDCVLILLNLVVAKYHKVLILLRAVVSH